MIGIYDDIVKNAQKEPEPEYVEINLVEDFLDFRKKLENLDSLSDQEIYDLIKNNYNTILNEIVMKNKSKRLELFENKRFITILITVFSTLNISYEDMIYCNKIVYDFITFEENPDKELYSLMLEFSKVVNKNIVSIIMGLGIDEELANKIALSRYSSLKEIINVKRLNLVLLSGDPEVLTEQNLIYIYERLFDRMIYLFEGTILDCMSLDTQSNEYIIYKNETFAVLDILENMDSNSICTVLKSYLYDFNYLYNDKIARVSLYNLPNEYGRIINILNLNLQGLGLMIP